MSVAQGYKAAVGSTYNYAAPIYNNVRKSLSVGDFKCAQIWQKRALDMITAMFATCGRSSLKVMMQMVGIDCGPVRRPIDPASPDQVMALKKRLDKMGWFEWINEDLNVEIS